MVKTRKAEKYRECKRLCQTLDIDHLQFNSYLTTPAPYWDNVYFYLRSQIVSRMFMKRLALRPLPLVVEWIIYKY